jgi:hypothetical protein
MSIWMIRRGSAGRPESDDMVQIGSSRIEAGLSGRQGLASQPDQRMMLR